MDLSTSLPALLQEESRRLGLALAVLKPARVLSHDPDTHTAEVAPLWPMVYRDSDGAIRTQEIPPITVPVWRWIVGGFELVFALAPGECVGLIVADRSLGPHLEAGPATADAPLVSRDPLVSRAHDLSDAIAIPGLLASELGRSAEAPLTLRHLSGLLEIAIYPDGRVTFGLGGEADQHAVRGDVLAAYLTAHKTWVEATLSALGAWLAIHGHAPGPVPGAPLPVPGAGPPLLPPPPLTGHPVIPADLLSALLTLR